MTEREQLEMTELRRTLARYSNPWTLQIQNVGGVWSEWCYDDPLTLAEAEHRLASLKSDNQSATFRVVPWMNSSQHEMVCKDLGERITAQDAEITRLKEGIYQYASWQCEAMEGADAQSARIAELQDDIAHFSVELSMAQSSYRDLGPCGHARNFLIGDEHGRFTCTVCRVAELEHERDRNTDAADVDDEKIVALSAALKVAREAIEAEEHAKGCAAAWFKRQRDNRWLHRTYIVHADCNCWKRDALAIKAAGDGKC